MKAKINGIELAFDLIDGHPPAPLLLHGFGLNRTIWRELIENYLGGQQVIVPDLRGHGESDVPPGPYSMALLAQDMAGLLESLGVERAIVCGHSMGGYVTLAFAEQFPEKLAGLGLITTTALADSADKRTGRYDLIKQVQKRGSITVAESLAPRLSNVLGVVNQSHALISQCDPMGLIGSLQGMADRDDKTDVLQKIKVPALAVAGEDDRITDYAESQAMAAAICEGTFIGMPSVGHMPMLENPNMLGQALCALTERVRTASFD